MKYIGLIKTDDLPSTSIGLRVSEMAKLGFSPIILYAKSRTTAARQFRRGIVVSNEQSLREEIAKHGDCTIIMATKHLVDANGIKALGEPKETECRCLTGQKFVGCTSEGDRSVVKVFEYDRRRGVSRFDRGDSGDVEIDIPSNNGLMAMRSAGFLKMLEQGDAFISAGDGFQKEADAAGVYTVCTDPISAGVSWHYGMIHDEKKPINIITMGNLPIKRNIDKNSMARTESIAHGVLVSISTYRKRFPILEEVLGSIFSQTVSPEKVCIAVDSCDIPYIPEFLKKLHDEKKVEILVGSRELGPHNKYVHAMLKYPSYSIITFDDDAIYRPNAIEELVKTSEKNPGCVVARRVHLIKYDDTGTPLPYKQWVNQCMSVPYPSFDLLATGVGGVLYPAGVFKLTADDVETMKLFKADDIFLKKMENNLGIRVVHTGTGKDADERIRRDGAQDNALLLMNVNGGNNDVEIARIGLKRKDRGDSIFFRIVIPVYKSVETLKRAIRSIAAQSFSSYVAIVCDDGSPERDRNENRKTVEALGGNGVFIFNEENLFAGAARNVCAAYPIKTEYTLFLDADDQFAYSDAFMDLYRFILANGFPDVIALPFFNRRGESTVRNMSKVTSPAALALTRLAGTPWTKCIKSCKVQPFSTGLRRSNDVMQHYLTADSVSTVVPFYKEVVRYMLDSETTMFGPYGKENRRSKDALSCYLKCAVELMEHKWKHDYVKSGVAVEIAHIVTRMAPSLAGELGINGIRNFFA